MGAPCFRGRGRGTGRTGELCARRAAPAGTRPGSRAHPKSRMQAVMNQCLRRNVKYTCRQKAGGAAERLAAGSGACAEQQSCRRRWPGAQPHDGEFDTSRRLGASSEGKCWCPPHTHPDG